MRKRLLILGLGLCWFATQGTAQAAVITYFLTVTINGDTPSGTPAVTIEDLVANTVRLTMDLTGTPAAQFTDAWLFNFNGTQAALNALTITYDAGLSTGPQASSITRAIDGVGNNNTPGFGNNSSGLMDLEFEFPTPAASRFNGGEKVVYTITGTGLTTSSFNVASSPPFNTNGPYFTAAAFQGIPGASGGVVGANTVSVVPEPSSVVLLGGGLMLCCLRRLRRKS